VSFLTSNSLNDITLYWIQYLMKKFDKNTCSGKHIDNVLDSFGLQESYVYGEISVSDHLPVLVTLLGAKPIYNLDILSFYKLVYF
jgi:exonuclease III